MPSHKLVKRVCPKCGVEKEFRADHITCGCRYVGGVVPAVPVADVVLPKESDQLNFLRKELSRVRGENAILRDNSGFLDELKTDLADALQASVIEPLNPIPYKAQKGLAESDIYAVLKLSDWHIGMRTSEEETDGFGRFNWEIAQERVQYLGQKFLGGIGAARRSFNIPKLFVFGEADWISGNIHEELRATNEFPIPVQSVKAGQLLAQLVASLAPHFPEVHFVQVGADNHGRLQPKPQFKQKAQNNMSFIVYALANEILREHKNINVIPSVGIKKLVDVNGKAFLVEHGDDVKAWMGIPFYGLERYRGKEAAKRMRSDFGFDYMSVGHWHVAGLVSGNIIMNGSLTGTDEFDHGCGRHADPAQVSFLVHPRHGIFNFTAWKPKR